MEELQIVPAYELENYIVQPAPDKQPDPDNPRWGVLGGIGVWFGSVAALILIPSIAVAILFIAQQASGQQMPVEKEALNKWIMSPPILLTQISTTIFAHLITIGLCWAVATRFGKFSFKETMGWAWNASTIQKVIITVGIIGGTIGIMQLLPRFIPDSQTTPFSEMLKSSQAVRYAVACLAVLTAPITEELVYRGLIYAPLKRALGIVGAVSISTLLFAVVHVPQYWGAWASLTGLLLLSLALTITRAKTKSIYPCVVIHTLFNFIGAIGIIWGGGKS